LLLSHLDTSEDAPGENVQPIIHENYDGKEINLNSVVIPLDKAL
jgi:tripeptide aminopeptidase